jgi:hypothetical protein
MSGIVAVKNCGMLGRLIVLFALILSAPNSFSRPKLKLRTSCNNQNLKATVP